VTTKVLEAFFRHKLLILLPPILITLIVGPAAYFTAPVYYEGWAAVWAGQATYLGVTDQDNPYMTPAQSQGGRLGELLKTQTFLIDVVRRTPLAPLSATPAGQQQLQTLVVEQVSTQPGGNNLLVIRYRGPTPQTTMQVLQALLDAYREKTLNDRSSQGTLAVSFYESRVQAVEEKAAQSNEGLRRYIQGHARLQDDLALSGDLANQAAVADPQLVQLQHQAEFDQKELEDAKASLQKAQFQVDASLEGQDLSFQVIDAPHIPNGASRDLKKLLLAPAAGLLLALIGSGVLLVVLVASDRSVRAESDLSPGVHVLGVVPHLALKGLPKRDRAEATRRGIGFTAGAALVGSTARRAG
jgi:hypothetical protein